MESIYMNSNEILAKSNGESLIEHTENCLKVFKSIKSTFPYLLEESGSDSLWVDLFIALLFHDTGKVAKGFQQQLSSNRIWGYRHEIISASILLSTNFALENRNAIAL